MKKEDLKFYALSFFVVILVSFVFVYLQHLQILPQNSVTASYYKFRTSTDFLRKMSIVAFLLYLFPIGYKYKKSRRTDMICPKCENVEEVINTNLENKQCSKCGTKLQPLNEFY